MWSGFFNNIAAAINLTVMGLVLVTISSYVETGASEQSLVASAGMIGAVSGQLIMGFLGDCLGRMRALGLTTVVILVGSLLSAYLPQGESLLTTLAICRFVVGFGVGGVYPLTAVASAEDKSGKGASSVLIVFSGQGWGQLLAPLLVYLLISSDTHPEDLWRTTLALSAVPSALAMLLMIRDVRRRMQEEETMEIVHRVVADHPEIVELQEEQRQDDSEVENVSFVQAFFNWKNFLRLCGTGGTWFIFDVTFYANVVFAPIVLKRVYGLEANSTIKELAGPTCIVFVLALPGYYVALAVVQRLGLKKLQIIGFIVLAVLYGLMAATVNVLPSGILFSLYAATFFVSNAGPNSTTFCLPAQTFPKATRSTFSGMSAAMGKAGAVVGTAMFPPILESGGAGAALGLSSVVALLGALLTHFLVESERPGKAIQYGDTSAVDLVEMSHTLFSDTNLDHPEPSKPKPMQQNTGAPRSPVKVPAGGSSAYQPIAKNVLDLT